MAADFPALDLPNWAAIALADSSLSQPRRDCVRWLGAAYQILMALNRFSLTEYANQVQELHRIADLATNGLRLTTRQQVTIDALLAEPQINEAERRCIAWMNEAGHLLAAINRFSLSEYGEQVRHLGQLTDLASKGLVLAKQADTLVAALHSTLPSSS